MGRVGLIRSFPVAASSVLVCGLIISFTLFFWVYHLEQRSEQATFERRAQTRIAAVEKGMSNATSVLEVVHQFFVVTKGNLSRAQFHSLTRPLRAQYPYIEAFAFSRFVSQVERPAFEARMRQRYPDFVIAELVDGKRVAAGVKGLYRVTDYVEPMAGNETAFGLDTFARSFGEDAVSRATDTGLLTATSLYSFFGDKAGSRPGIRLQRAVYRDGAMPDDITARRLAVIGYLVVLLRTDALFEKVLASAGSRGNAGLNIRIYASATADKSKLAYGTPGAAEVHREWWEPARWLAHRPEPVACRFDVAGNDWLLVISPQATPLASTYGDALLALLSSLLVTFAVTAYLRSTALRTQRIEQLVAQRTDQLKQANDLLVDDIAARKKVEQSLARSEERARELATLSSDWLWEQDENFRFTSFSTDVKEKGSRPLPTAIGLTRWEQQIVPDAANWVAHRAMLEAHQPFRNFEYSVRESEIGALWISVSGNPQFDADGNFKGYRGTARNITDRKLAEEALLRSRADLRQLAAHQEQVKEDERKRIAREIHDELGQNLMVLRLDLGSMAARADTQAIPKQEIEAALTQIDNTIKAVRAIINDLRPAVLDLGLHAAVQWQAKEFERRSGVAFDVQIDHEEFPLSEQHATALFRIVQESLTNIIRHARASRVRIEMQRKEGQLRLTIADDGVGIYPNDCRKENAFGLIGIEERIRALDGTFSIGSNPGQGMTIKLSVPL